MSLTENRLENRDERSRPLSSAFITVAGAVIGLGLAWILFGHLAPRLSSEVTDLLWVPLIISGPVLLWLALFALTSTRWHRGQAVVIATFGYLIIGFAYFLLRQGGILDRQLISIFLWPSLMYWQDLCHLGLWPCPE